MGEYYPQQIEPKWQRYWDEQKTFAAGVPGPKKFYCLDMFPYPSGSGLHVGHPLGYIATDIYSRFKRMNGYSVLHPMGWDAFGLPAEQHAVSTGEHPGVITKKNCEVFKGQMKMLGLSYDWDREIATCNADYYKWTQWIFLRLYHSWFDPEAQKARPIEELPIPDAISAQGTLAVQEYRAEHRLAFYGEALVNWCPALGTVLANEEVIDGKSERGGFDVIRKPMKQWMLRIAVYSERLLSELEEVNWPHAIREMQRHWIGRKTGAMIRFDVEGTKHSLEAFTTRPDTLFGVTFFVISPEHALVDEITTPAQRAAVEAYRENARKLSDLDRTMDNRKKTGVHTGAFVINPITKEKVPLYVGDYVLMSVGTGAVMGVPAHDERDFEFAKKFEIEIRSVIVPAEGDAERKARIEAGAECWTESGVMIPRDYSVMKELGIAGAPNAEAHAAIVGWLEKNGLGRPTVTYKLRDWLFSRQRYWGEPIPVIHWEDGEVTTVPESELPLVLPEVKDYKPSDNGESPLAKATEWLHVVDPKTGRKGIRETNTMPQWAGSCWYYLRFIDPKNETAGWDPALEKGWMNVDLYVGGAEHAVLHLLYARFWHKVLFDLGYVTTREPFKKLFNQGYIQAYAYKDARGALVPTDEVDEDAAGGPVQRSTGQKLERIIAKMSKSVRNVVNPDDVIAEYGADTLRTYLMFMGPLDSSRIWDTKAILGSHRFLKRSWTLLTENRDDGMREFVSETDEPAAVKRAIHRLIKSATDDVEALQLNTVVSSMMEFLNAVGTLPISKETAERYTLILSPFAPHLGEELWRRLGHADSIQRASWPTYEEKYLEVDQVSVVVQVSGKKRAVLEVAPTIDEASLKTLVIEKLAGTEYAVGGDAKFITVFQPKTSIPKLVNVIPK